MKYKYLFIYVGILMCGQMAYGHESFHLKRLAPPVLPGTMPNASSYTISREAVVLQDTFLHACIEGYERNAEPFIILHLEEACSMPMPDGTECKNTFLGLVSSVVIINHLLKSHCSEKPYTCTACKNQYPLEEEVKQCVNKHAADLGHVTKKRK